MFELERAMLPVTANRKNGKLDNLAEEILRERAVVLSRAGFAVSDILDSTTRLEKEIEKKLHLLKTLNGADIDKLSQGENAICAEINVLIEKFNAACEKAQLKYYYLIVTREALGLYKHEYVQEIYQIPQKKKKVQL